MKSLKTNFFINNILDVLANNRRRRERSQNTHHEQHLNFPECKCQKETDGKCQTCNVALCESCVDNHLKNPQTKHHKIISEKPETSLCDEHSEEKKFFCQKCEELCCVECVALMHSGHEYIEIKKVLKSQKRMIDWLLVRCKAKIPTLNQEIKWLEVMEEMTSKNAQDTETEIDEEFEKLIAALEKKRVELKEGVQTLRGEKLKQIYFQKENITMVVESLLSGIEFTEQATKEGNEKEFLSMRKQICARLEELSEIKMQKSSFDGRWNFYLQVPYQADLVNGFRVQSDTVKATLTMVGGEEGLIYNTFKNQSRDFIITLKDENGTKMMMGGQNVRVAIRIPSDNPPPKESTNEKSTSLNYVDIDVQDNHDGTHSFTYKPKHQGMYYLRVTVNGRPLSGDLMWTVDGSLGFGDSTNEMGVIQVYPPFGMAPAWHRVVGAKNSWKIKRIYYDEYTVVRAGVMMDLTSNKWGWCNGRREEPEEFIFSVPEYPFSNIPSWQEGEEFTFYSNEETGRFIIYSEACDKSEVFKRCPGTVARPFIYPALYSIFSMDSTKLEKKLIKKHASNP